jgi:LysM repeat protein
MLTSPTEVRFLLDISLFMEDLLDAGRIKEKAPQSNGSLEVPGAVVQMIQQMVQTTRSETKERSLLVKFIYAYLKKLDHGGSKRDSKRTASELFESRDSGQETDRLWNKAERSAWTIIREYAPLIEGALHPTDESSPHVYPSERNSTSAKQPIGQYSAFSPITEDELRELRRSYRAELDLEPNPVFDLYFRQVYHGLRFGVAASPAVPREIIARSRSTFEVIRHRLEYTSNVIGQTERQFVEGMEPWIGAAREHLKWFIFTYLKEEWVQAALSGGLDLVIELIPVEAPFPVPVLIPVIGGLLIGAILKAKERGLLTRTQTSVGVIAVIIGSILVYIVIVLLVQRVQPDNPSPGLTVVPPDVPSPVSTGGSVIVTPFATPETERSGEEPRVTSSASTPTITSSHGVRIIVLPEDQAISPPTSSAGYVEGYCLYVVQPSDTLSGIAARFQISLGRIRAADNEPLTERLRLHQKLEIEADCCRSNGGQGATYTVHAGERLSIIARRYGTTVAAIVAANGLQDANYIQAGQMLCVP